MGVGLNFIDILIFAMIAAFLVFRLRSVLGRRTGHEKQRPSPYSSRPPVGQRGGDNVVSLPERERADDEVTTGEGNATGHGLTQVKIADPSFQEQDFLKGATAAFQMIVDAFAKADTASLRPLLSDELYDEFSTAVRERLQAGEVLENKIEEIEAADLLEGRVEGRTAFVTVKFVSRQINVTRDRDGEVVDGDPDTTTEVTDIWTFARNTRSSDPNWTLVETRTPN